MKLAARILTLLVMVALASFTFSGCKNKAVAKMEELTKKACECKDAKCAATVTKEWAEWAKANKDKKVSKSDGEKIKKSAEKYAECVKKAMTGKK